MDNKDVIITGSLDYSEIDKSINDLVRKIETNTRKVADSYDNTIAKIEKGMKGITSIQSSVISGIEQEIAASKQLTEAIDKLNKTREKGKKTESKSMNEVLGMPIDTEKAINAKLKALEKLRKTTPISTEGYETIKKEYIKLSNLRKELLKTEEEKAEELEKQQKKAAEDKAKAEKQRLREKEEISKKIAKADKERQKEYEATSKKIAKAEQERLKEREKIVAEAIRKKKEKEAEAAKQQKQYEKEITAELKKRDSLRKQRGTRAADSILGMHETNLNEMEKKVRDLVKYQKYLSDKGLLSQSKINQMTRAIDRLQAKINKTRETTVPMTKKDILGMPENTLNEISAKMQAVKALRANTKINSAEINRLNNEYNRLNVLQRRAVSSGLSLAKQNKSLATTFKNLSERVVFYLGLGALTGFVRNIYQVRGEYELLERSIGVLINQMEKGSQIFRELQAKAKESPYTLIELASATKQLAAYDFSQKELINTTSKLADISSALNVPIERLVYNLGQIKAQDVLNARDARDFANAGLAIVPMLAKMYSLQEDRMVSTAEVYDRMKKKMVSYTDVLKVLYSVTDKGGKFYDFQAKQAETLKVKINNLALAYNDMLNDIGKSNSGMLNFFVEVPKKIFENWRKVASILNTLVPIIGIYKVSQFVLNKAIANGIVYANRSVEVNRKKEIQTLRNIQATRGLTIEEERNLVTCYSEAITQKNLTKAQAMSLLVRNKLQISLRSMLTLGRHNTMMQKRNLVLLRQAIVETGLLTKAEARLAKMSTLLSLGFVKIAESIATFLFNPTTLILAAISAITTIISKIDEAKQELDDFNKAINDSAKETSQNLNKFIKENKETFSKIGKTRLTDENAINTWDVLKEQITSATTEGERFVEELMRIDNVNDRLIKAKKILMDILSAEKSLADYSVSIKYNSGGIFEDGLAEDIVDFINAKDLYSQYQNNPQIKDLYKKAQDEVLEEIDKFSTSLTNKIIATGNKSETAIRTILAKVKNEFLSQHQEISGFAADYFNLMVDKKVIGNLNQKWHINMDKNAMLWKKLMENIKHDSSAAFADITSDMLKNARTFKQLPEKMQMALREAQIKLLSMLPDFHNEIQSMLNNLGELKMNIALSFNIRENTDVQKMFNEEVLKQIGNGGLSLLRPEELNFLKNFAPKNQDNFYTFGEYVKTSYENEYKRNKALEAERKNLEQQGKDLSKIDKELNNSTKTLKGWSTTAKEMGISLDNINKKKSTGRKQESLLAKAIKLEISLISELNSSYEKLNRTGIKREDSIAKLNELYSKQVTVINNILGIHGLPKFDIDTFAGKDLTSQKEYLDKLVSTMKKLGLDKKEMSAFKSAGSQLTKVTIDSMATGMKDKIKGIQKAVELINKEHGFAKDLSKEEEMRNFFSLIGINMDNLPRTAEDVKTRMQDALAKEGIYDFDVLKTDVDTYAEEHHFDKESELYRMLKEISEKIRNTYKNEFVERIQNLKDYIDKYGTAQEQIYQITKHYDHLIANEQDAIRRKSLKKEKQEKINEAKMREISRGIDWGVAMPEIGGIIRKVAKKVLDDVNTYMNSAQFKALPANQQKSWYDLKNQLNKTTGGNSTSPFNFGIWGKIANQMKDWEKAVQELKDSQGELKTALDKLKKAEENGYDTTQENADVKKASEKVTAAENKVNESQQELTNSSEKATNGLQGFANALNEVTNGSLYGLFKGFSKLITIITGGVAKSLSELGGKIGGVIGAVLQIMDALGENSKERIAQWIDSIGNTIENIVRDLPSIFANIVKGAWNAIGGIYDGVGHWFGLDINNSLNHSNAKQINELTEKLTKSNERLAKSIDYLSEIMGNEAGAKAIFASEKAMQAQLEIDKNAREKWIAQMNYHGSHHSNAYYFRDAYFAQWEEEIKKALKAAGLDERVIKSWADVQTLSAEEMAAIRAFAPTAFQYLEEVGEYDKSKYLNEFADLAGEIEKLENKINENLTQISFDSLRDSFLSALTDMEKDAEDFANDFQKILFKSMINKFLLGDDFKKWLQELYKRWADKIKNGNPEDLSGFRQEVYNKYLELMSGRDALANAINYKGDKGLDLSSLQQGIQSITEETGGAIEAYLNGISAQVYLSNDKLQELINLTQVNTGSNSEIIQIMKNNLESVNVIKNTILDCLSPNNRALQVELIN